MADPRKRSKSVGSRPDVDVDAPRPPRSEVHDSFRRRPRSASVTDTGGTTRVAPAAPLAPQALPVGPAPAPAPAPAPVHGPAPAPAPAPAPVPRAAPIRQGYQNSCGANALLHACLELGTTHIPQRNEYPLWSMGHTELRPDMTCESMIYSVTSGLNGRPPAPDTGYSLPSYIAECAAALGRRASVYLPPSVMTLGLVLSQPADVARALRRGVPLNFSAAPALNADQRLMRVMQVTGGLHYVLERDDGSVWDPALAQSFPDMPSLIAAQAINGGNYSDTGIAVLIE